MTKGNIKIEEHLHFLLCEKKFETVIDVLKSPDNDTFVSENIWSLMDTICITIKLEKLLKNDRDVASCRKILLLLVNKGDPKEVLVYLMEHADSQIDHQFFCLLLDPFRYTLRKCPGKRGISLQWVLHLLNKHIATLDEPADLDLQGEEMILLDADPAVYEATYVLSNYLPFINFLVDEVSFENLKKKEVYYIDRIYHQQELLQRYILKLFYKPLLFHDLSDLGSSRPKSAIQSLCEGYVKCLSKICRNVFNLFKYDNDDNVLETSTDQDAVPSLAFCNLSYLIFVEKHNLVLFKGLDLALKLLLRLDDLQLNYSCTELEAFTKFPKCLWEVAISYQYEQIQKVALHVFFTYVSKCNYEGRYHLIMQTLCTVKHSGAEGIVIGLYKEFLHEALNGNASLGYFLGKNFTAFAKKVFVLRDGVETDIVECGEEILTVLNFLRYILLRDAKEVNSTGIWNLVSYISENLIVPLTTGLDFSRAHYQQAILEEEDDKRNKTKVAHKRVIMPANTHKKVYERALMAFDLIESVLARVKELIL